MDGTIPLKHKVEAVLRAYARGERCPPRTEQALRAVLLPHHECPLDCPLRAQCPTRPGTGRDTVAAPAHKESP